MKVHVPGFPVRYVDEPELIEEVKAEANPLPSVDEAIAQADARQAQVLNYTRSAPLKEPDLTSTADGQNVPRPVTDKPKPKAKS
jgi:hypothetical protein